MAAPTTGGTLKENAGDVQVAVGNSGTTKTIDFSAGPNQAVTLTGNCTFTFTAPIYPATLRLLLTQDGTGSRTVTWPSTVDWAGGTAPTLTTTAAHYDLITMFWNGSKYFGSSLLDLS